MAQLSKVENAKEIEMAELSKVEGNSSEIDIVDLDAENSKKDIAEDVKSIEDETCVPNEIDIVEEEKIQARPSRLVARKSTRPPQNPQKRSESEEADETEGEEKKSETTKSSRAPLNPQSPDRMESEEKNGRKRRLSSSSGNSFSPVKMAKISSTNEEVEVKTIEVEEVAKKVEEAAV